jgi:ParB/RepB/Spo0J family partition protein
VEFDLIALDLIRCDHNQSRQAIDPEGVEELARSIRERGILQPIRVRRAGNEYQLIAGQRRWTAARSAGLTEIPALIIEATDDQALVEGLIENIQREDLNAVDRARALKHLRVTLGLHSWEEVGRRLGISRIHVHRLLNVSRLPERMQDDMRAGDLTEKHGRALLRLRRNPDLQTELWEQIHTKRLSGDAAVEAANDMLPAREGKHKTSVQPSGHSELKDLADQLLTVLLAATPHDVSTVRAELSDLREWLCEVLEGRNGRFVRSPVGGPEVTVRRR